MQKLAIITLLFFVAGGTLANNEHPIKQRILAQCLSSGTARGGELEQVVKQCVCGFEIYAQNVTLKQHIELDRNPDAVGLARVLGTRQSELQKCVALLD